jgi:hypothetical protein
MPVTNEDARAVLKVGRRGTYYWLSELTRLTMLEKKGQRYRASPYSKALMMAVSTVFGSLVMGKIPEPQVAAIHGKNALGWNTVLQTATEGLELLYARGRIDESERMRRQKIIDEFRRELDVPNA